MINFRKIKYMYKDFIYGIRSLIKWFSVIWRDRDWDWFYILKLEYTKLNNIVNRLDNAEYYIGQENDIKNMKLCIKLIDIITNDEDETVYVNIKNSDMYKRCIENGISENVLNTMKGEIRQDKAIKLYYKIKSENLLKWWD